MHVPETEVITELYHGAWNDFLSNKRSSAVTRAKAALMRIEHVTEQQKLRGETLQDLMITKADLYYIQGASQSDDRATLLLALKAYDDYLEIVPNSRNATRMKAETQLRLHDYDAAWTTFERVSALAAQEPLEELEIAPFRLNYDAELLESLIGKNLVDASKYSRVAEDYRTIARLLASGDVPLTWEDDVSARLHRTKASNLPSDLMDKLRGVYNKAIDFLPDAKEAMTRCYSEWRKQDPLNGSLDWETLQAKYLRERLVIIDDLFSPDALEELLRYTRAEANFRTMRAGFLGAFPGDGTTHPIIKSLALELERKMPDVFSGHPLGLWWFFKYTDEAPRGIGIHADPAAVNINVWLTPDESRVSGGGLEVFKLVPPAEVTVREVNHERTAEEEAEFYKILAEDGIVTIPYKCNRAAIFVSDQYHVSEPFEFKTGLENHRINLTLLFGDRVINQPENGTEKKAAYKDDGWDLFD